MHSKKHRVAYKLVQNCMKKAGTKRYSRTGHTSTRNPKQKPCEIVAAAGAPLFRNETGANDVASIIRAVINGIGFWDMFKYN